jgi:hypothetical protein
MMLAIGTMSSQDDGIAVPVLFILFLVFTTQWPRPACSVLVVAPPWLHRLGGCPERIQQGSSVQDPGSSRKPCRPDAQL